MLLYQIIAYTIHGKNIKSCSKNNKFKISAPAWNEQFELLDGSCSVSDIQDFFEYILRKHGEKIFNPPVIIYIKNRKENYV